MLAQNGDCEELPARTHEEPEWAVGIVVVFVNSRKLAVFDSHVRLPSDDECDRSVMSARPHLEQKVLIISKRIQGIICGPRHSSRESYAQRV